MKIRKALLGGLGISRKIQANLPSLGDVSRSHKETNTLSVFENMVQIHNTQMLLGSQDEKHKKLVLGQ